MRRAAPPRGTGRHTRSGRRRLVAVTALCAAALGACLGAPAGRGPSAATAHAPAAGGWEWERVGLPGEGVVVTVTAVPQGLLIGRYAEGTARPVGLSWWTDESRRDGTNPAGPAGSARRRQDAPAGPTSPPPVPLRGGPVPLQAISGYAPQARWQAMAAAAGDVVALGGARGGAHGNVRWTVWHGSTAGLVEQPQTFETFGVSRPGR